MNQAYVVCSTRHTGLLSECPGILSHNWNSSATTLTDRSSDGRISTVDVLIASDPNSTTAAGLIVDAENRIPRRWVYIKTYLTYLSSTQYYF